MEGIGTTRDDYKSETDIDVWPENWAKFQLFLSLDTQWRIGAAGPTGLDYNVMPTVFEMRHIPRAEWPVMFDVLHHMEVAALEEMRKR